MLRTFSFIAACFALAGCIDKGPWDGPFGTKKGITKGQIEQFAKLELDGESERGGAFSSKQAPSMTEKADAYRYFIGKSSGLCRVDVEIEDVRSSGSTIAAKLAEKYGKPEKDPNAEWGVVWSRDKYKLDNDIRSIRITFFGAEPNVDALVQVEYMDVDDCK
jgi:hypothetical protein